MQSFEELLEELGGMGRFQVMIICWICSCQITIGWSMLQMSYIGILPDFTCVPEKLNSTILKNITLLNYCGKETMCSSYDYHSPINTLTEEFDLICDRTWIKKTIISCQMAGVLVGALLAGQSGDLIGRKKSLYGFTIFHIILNIVAAFSTSWIMFNAIRFGIGISMGAILVIVLPYPMEFLPMKWRPIIAIIPSWTLGVAVFAGAAFVLQDWSHLHIACAVASIPSVFGWFFVPESIRWLALQGRIKEAEDVFVRIARINGKPLSESTRQVLQHIMRKEREAKTDAKKYTYIDVLRGWKTFKVTSVIFFFWFTMALSFYGISFGVGSLFGNLYLNIFLLGVLEIPVQCCTFFTQNRFGRRNSALFFFTMAGLVCISCIVIHHLAADNVRGVAISVLSLIAKMLTGCAWSCIQTWGPELYPTVTRSLGYGFTSVGGRVGGVLAPYVIDLHHQVEMSYSIMAALYVACAVLTFVLDETKGMELKDSLGESDVVGLAEEFEPLGDQNEAIIPNGNNVSLTINGKLESKA